MIPPGGAPEVGLPGRPGGDADALRAGARAWDHLAWEVWHLTRPMESRMTALLEGWSGPSADAYRARWEQVNRGLGEFDHRVHMCSDRIRRLAGKIEDAQSAYDHALGLAGITAVAGIGLTLFTAGASDAVAGEAEATIGANLVGIVAEFEAEVGRLAALIGEMADFMGSLATRFAIEFEIRAPAPVIAAAAGAATNVAFTLADGDRDPVDVIVSAAIGAAAEVSAPGRLPNRVTDTLDSIDQTGTAPSGVRGGGQFLNDGRGGGTVLPPADATGNAITYREWDVNSYQPRVNRGAERLVTGSDGSAWYTADHYATFTRVR